MTASQRNYTWVMDHAQAIATAKVGYAYGCFTIGEVREALGLSRNTIKKYLDYAVPNGVIYIVNLAPGVSFYRFAFTDVQTPGYNDNIPF